MDGNTWHDTVAALAARKGVRGVAVENFLSTLEGMRERDALANLSADARLYGWNAPTQAAIRAGIAAYFRGL